MKYYFLIGLIFFTVLNKVIAQIDRDVLLLRTTVYTREDAPQPNANVTVLQSGKTFSQTTSDAAGNVVLKLPLNNDYTIIISKPGMLTKKFNVSTRGPVMGTEAKRYYEFEVEGIKIYEPFEGVDYSIFKQPLFTVTFDEKKNRFDVDKQSIEAVQSQINLVYQSEKDVEKKKKEAEKKYQDIIKNADAAFKNNKLEEAKNLYTQALSLKPNEQYPKNQIELIDKTLAELKAKQEAEAKAKAELEAKYQAAIKKGDEAFAKKDWTTAKAGYNEALGYKPNEKYPKDQLAAIEKAIADELAQKKKQEEELKKQQELEAKYQAAIKKGDEAFAKKDWTTAKAGYNEALGYKPNEKYPKDQLAAIEKAIADELAQKKKQEEELKKQQELEAKYQAAIKKGDEAFAKKDWTTAKAGYNEALGYKPNEKYPKDQLAAIEKAIADELAQKKKQEEELKKQQELEAKYQAAIKKGDEAFAKKDWTTAKAGYNEALGYKPNEKYPKDQLAAIEKAIADELAQKKKQEEELKKQQELEAKYQAAIKKGDEAFAKKDWTTAKAGYNEALGYKPNEKYPKDQLAAIEKAIADELAQKKKQEEELKKQQELEAKYQAAIKKGDEAFAKKDWTTAKAGYNEALGYKPNEKYPKDQLAAIEKAIADELAQKKKQEEELKKQQELEAKYQAAIKKGDEAFAKKDWTTAKAGYNEALGYKPNEKYPKDQLAAIEKAIADELAQKKKQEEELKKQQELEAKYQAAIKKGDEAFAKKDWTTAKAGYNEALGYKPNEKYPKDQLAAIEKAIADELAQKKKQEEELKKQQELEAKYQAAIKKGDEAFAKKDWTTAKAGYNEALGYKPNEKYPKDQLAAIEKAIADELAQKKKQEEELKKQQELEAKYQAAIKKGDEAFAKKDWTTAKAGYNEALGYKPNEKYPKDQLAAIEKAIAESKGIVIKNQEKIDKEIKTNKEKNVKPVLGSDDKYKSVIKLADEYFNKQQYESAKTKYEEAMVYKPSDPYAKQKLLEIEKILNSDTKKNKKELSDRVKELIAKYPPGVTEKIFVERDVTIYQRIVVKGDSAAYVYEKKVFSFGLIRYFRDGEPCTEAEFETETKLR
jgi:phage shock protein A